MKQRRTINFIEKLNEKEMSNLKGGISLYAEDVEIVVYKGKLYILIDGELVPVEDQREPIM